MCKLQQIELWLGGVECAAHYGKTGLRAEDEQRVRKKPELAQRTQWQISRFLKSQTQLPQCCLSHSRDMAACLAWQKGRAGVDLEYLAVRDFRVWYDYLISDIEAQWLAQQNGHYHAYYALWCLKESLVKAMNLALPDMGRVGIGKNAAGDYCVRGVDDAVWCARAWLVDREYMLVSVWEMLWGVPDLSMNVYGNHLLEMWSDGAVFQIDLQ